MISPITGVNQTDEVKMVDGVILLTCQDREWASLNRFDNCIPSSNSFSISSPNKKEPKSEVLEATIMWSRDGDDDIRKVSLYEPNHCVPIVPYKQTQVWDKKESFKESSKGL